MTIDMIFFFFAVGVDSRRNGTISTLVVISAFVELLRRKIQSIPYTIKTGVSDSTLFEYRIGIQPPHSLALITGETYRMSASRSVTSAILLLTVFFQLLSFSTYAFLLSLSC